MTTIAHAGLLLLAFTLEPVGTPPAPESSYDVALRAAVSRAQADFEKSTELWVDHSRWEDPWIVQTEHYEVHTTRSRHFGLRIAEGLETMFGHFQSVLGRDYQDEARLRILIHPSMVEYNQFGDDFGEEHSSFYGSFHATSNPDRPVATFYDVNQQQLNMWVTHSAVHQYIDRTFGQGIPFAVEEAIASYFTLFWNVDWGTREMKRIIDTNRFIPIEQLLREGAAAYTADAHTRMIEGGMFMMYLLNFREDTRIERDANGEVVREPFADYLRLRLADSDDVALHPLNEMMTTGLEQLEADFRAYFSGE